MTKNAAVEKRAKRKVELAVIPQQGQVSGHLPSRQRFGRCKGLEFRCVPVLQTRIFPAFWRHHIVGSSRARSVRRQNQISSLCVSRAFHRGEK